MTYKAAVRLIYQPMLLTLSVGCLLALLLPSPPANAQRPVAATFTSTPVFDDEFTETSLDPSRWDTLVYPGHGQGTFRVDPTFYKPEGVVVGEHMLRIVTERIPETDPKTGILYPLRSGRAQTKQAFLYGKFVLRAKLPSGAGLWPSLWMRTAFGKPFSGEIDIVEGHGSHPNIAQSTLHHWVNGIEPYQDCAWLFTRPQPDGKQYQTGNCTRVENIPFPADLAADFHTYTLEWTPDRVAWYLDGHLYFQATKDIPQVPMVIVISSGFSHNWDGGSPDTVQLPQALQVNYVRVYGLAR